MKRVETCIVEDCIPVPSNCITWTGESIPYLGIYEGDSISPIIAEIITEIKRIAGKDLSTFDIPSLLKICDQKAPEEISLISILTLLRDNQVCLKDFVDELDKQLAKLLEGKKVTVNLRCYTGLNGLGLSITREELDQLIINKLCAHEAALDSIDSSLVRMNENIDEKRRQARIEEVTVSTCINSETLPLSQQVQNTSKELCDYIQVVGTTTNIADALANTPVDLNAEFGSIPGWNMAPVKWSEYYKNTLLEIQNIRERVIYIEENCCAVNCDKVKIGFTMVLNEDKTGVIIKFNKGAGTVIPKGFEDCGSTGTLTDANGLTQDFDLAISMGATIEITLDAGMHGDITADIAAQMCNTDKGVQCNKCASATLIGAGCEFCTLTASGPVTITYKTCI